MVLHTEEAKKIILVNMLSGEILNLENEQELLNSRIINSVEPSKYGLSLVNTEKYFGK